MGRTAIGVALATALAIAAAIALRAPQGNGVVELPAGDSAPSAGDLPVARDERERATPRSSSSPGADGRPNPAADGVEARASRVVEAPVQQRTDDDLSTRAAAAAKSEPSSGSDESAIALAQSSLSAQEAHDFFVEGDACEVLARDAKDKQRCTRAAALAKLIVTVPKTSKDSWAYGMEHELNRRLTELLDAGELALVKRRAVHCNTLGCLVYVEGLDAWPGKFKRLASQIRSDPDIAELNLRGEWPNAATWDHGVDNGAMIVMPRAR